MARTDRLTRDLERAFAALDEGDLDAARAAHARASKEAPRHPGVLALAGALAEEDGDLDAALASYRALMAAVPEDAAPRIKVAQLALDTGAEADEVLALIEPVFDELDEEDDLIGAILVKAAALLVRGGPGDPAAAREALGELASSAIDDPLTCLELADLALHAEDLPAARRWLEAAQAQAEDDDDELRANALHLLGHVHEAAGETAARTAAWQAVRRILAGAPAGGVEIAVDEVERITLATLAELPADVRARLENVPILIADLPSDGQIEDGVDPRSLGLFSGAPLAEEGAIPTVTTIHLFKKNLELGSVDLDDLTSEIRTTVLHEAGHYFGLDEEQVAALGLA